jgi:hypothetical protein
MLPPTDRWERSLQRGGQASAFKTFVVEIVGAEEQGNGILMIGINGGGTDPHVRFGADCVYARLPAPWERVYQEEFEMNALGPLVNSCTTPSRWPAVASVTQEVPARNVVSCPEVRPAPVGALSRYQTGFWFPRRLETDQATSVLAAGYDRALLALHKNALDVTSVLPHEVLSGSTMSAVRYVRTAAACPRTQWQRLLGLPM